MLATIITSVKKQQTKQNNCLLYEVVFLFEYMYLYEYVCFVWLYALSKLWLEELQHTYLQHEGSCNAFIEIHIYECACVCVCVDL